MKNPEAGTKDPMETTTQEDIAPGPLLNDTKEEKSEVCTEDPMETSDEEDLALEPLLADTKEEDSDGST